MKLNWNRIVVALCLITYSVCSNPANQAARPRLFDHDLSATDNLQSWDDWQAKRDLGGHHWDVGQLPPGTFQNWNEWIAKRGYVMPSGVDNFGLFDKSRLQAWQDWMAKRGLGSKTPFTGFSDLDRGQLQQWNDWMAKRSLGSKTPFTGFSDLDKGQFQQWNDWNAKRFYDMGGVGFGHGPNKNVGLQSWEDVAKRQNWQDWVKRIRPDKAYALTGYHLGKNDRYIKRQLGFNPERFGSFSRYFTDGLQDWRSTFKGMKRDKNETESNSEKQ